MKNNMRFLLFLVLVLLGASFVTPVLAQESPEISIRLSRDFGTGIGSRIEGTFSIHATGPDNLDKVEFYLNDESIGEDSEAPFRLQFQTGSFPPGQYTIAAIGTTSDGQELTSNTLGATFMSAEESRSSVGKMIAPVLGIVLLFTIGSVGMSLWAARRNKLEPGAPRQYGMAGGAICSRCHRAFPRHVLSPNMLVGKLERCPFCGKWAIVAAASPALLAAAEEAERQSLQEHVADSPISVEEKQKHRLDDSRFAE